MAASVSGRVIVKLHGARKAAPPRPSEPRIFVAIASYRDTECQWTVKDLFEKAAMPERVFAGICWQTVPEEDGDCFAVPSPRPGQTRIANFHVSQSQGVGWARAQAHRLWRGEEYLLNIDSHMRFVQDWDRLMLEQLRACPSPKPLLSTYPPGYTPPDQLGPAALTLLTAGYFDEAHVLVNKSRSIAPEDGPERPMPSMLYAAGFAFSSSQVLKEVPYDPFIYFQGEEITMATRLWTHGWDLYAPNAVLLYHAYGKTAKRKTHWADNRDWGRLNARSRARVAHLIGSKDGADAEALTRIEDYGQGQARPLDDYQMLSGIDFKQRRISASAAEGQFPLAPFDPDREKMRRVFTEIWRKNTYGNFETRSGKGSTLGSTRRLRGWLGSALARLGVASLVDAGCGDAIWLRDIANRLATYVGVDIVDEQVAVNAIVHRASPFMLFKAADITRDPLPRADAILCRDVLTHLTDEEARRALDLFIRSGARFLLATHFPKAAGRGIETGGWRPIDLEAPHLGLGPAQDGFVEHTETGKTLSIWQLPGSQGTLTPHE